MRQTFSMISARAVQHNQYASDVWLSGDEVEERPHGVDRVEESRVHVDVDGLRTLYLLAPDIQRSGDHPPQSASKAREP